MENLKEIQNLTVTIVGLGVIGAAFAQSFREIGIKTIYGIDIDEETLKKAEEKNMINKGFLETKDPLEKSDFVVITLYPNLMKSFFVNNIDNFKENAIITDVVGIKEKIIGDIDPIIEESNKKNGKNIIILDKYKKSPIPGSYPTKQANTIENTKIYSLFCFSIIFKITIYAAKANINHESPPSHNRKNSTFTVPSNLSTIAETIL